MKFLVSPKSLSVVSYSQCLQVLLSLAVAGCLAAPKADADADAYYGVYGYGGYGLGYRGYYGYPSAHHGYYYGKRSADDKSKPSLCEENGPYAAYPCVESLFEIKYSNPSPALVRRPAPAVRPLPTLAYPKTSTIPRG